MRPLLRKSSAAKVVALSVQTAPPASMPLVVCWCRVVLLSACSLAAAVCSSSAYFDIATFELKAAPVEIL